MSLNELISSSTTLRRKMKVFSMVHATYNVRLIKDCAAKSNPAGEEIQGCIADLIVGSRNGKVEMLIWFT